MLGGWAVDDILLLGLLVVLFCIITESKNYPFESLVESI